nr:hypothetical protein [Tanacetum cinerariifolium]
MLNRGIDSPLLGVNTPKSDEDRLKLMEMMVFLLQKGETVAEDVANEAIPSTPTPLILPSPPSHDIPSTSQVQSSPPQQPQIDQVKDANTAETEGRHAAEQGEKHEEIYRLDLDHPSKVLSMQEDDSEIQEVVEVVTTVKLITEVVTAATSQVSAASATISAAKPSILAAAPTVVVAYTRRRKGVIIRDPEEELSSKTPTETPKLKDKGKGMSYDEIRPIFQARFNANMRFLLKSREEMEEEDREVLKRINETPAHKAAKRRKLEEAQEVKDLKKHLEVVNDEDDDVFTEATPLARKTMLEKPDGQDGVWKSQRSVHVQALVKRWKLLTSCGVHIISLINIQLILLVERRYPLSNFTLEQLPLELMLSKRSRKNNKCVNAADEELTAAKHKLMLLVYCC